MSRSKFKFSRSLVASCTAGLGLALALAGTANAASDTVRYVVEFKPGMAAAARQALAAAGGRVKLEIIGADAVAIELPKHMVETLRKHGAIADISEDAIRYPLGLEANGVTPAY